MKQYPAEELLEMSRPIKSLISKSQKTKLKLSSGTWQHTRMEENLKALHLALALMEGTSNTYLPTQEDFQTALRTFGAMKISSKNAQKKFSQGTSQHSLLQNRLQAFCTAETLIRDKLKNHDAITCSFHEKSNAIPCCIV